MGVHCYLTELGAIMAVQVLAVLSLAAVALTEPGYGYGAAYHPYGGYSYTHRSPQGLHGYHHSYYGKREAEAEAEAEPGYGYGYGHATSYYHRSPQGLHGYHHGYYGK